MDVKSFLMQQARECGICKDGLSSIRTCKNVDELLAYYKRTIDWSLENEYPSLQQIKEMFVPADLERHGIFVDREFQDEEFSYHQVYVFHHCKGSIKVAMDYERCIIPMLYFANSCDLSITCTQKNIFPIRVPLYIFGENKIHVDNNSYADFAEYHLPILKD